MRTDTVLPSNLGYMDTVRYAALYSQATQFKARGSTTGLSYYISKAEADSATCHNMSSPIPRSIGTQYTTTYGHIETSGCTLSGSDYAWLSVETGGTGGLQLLRSGQSPGNVLWHQDSPTGSQSARVRSEAAAEMYIR